MFVQFGEIEDIRIWKSYFHGLYGGVKFVNEKDKYNVLKLTLEERYPKKYSFLNALQISSKKEIEPLALYVTGYEKGMTEYDLQTYFQNFGDL